MKKILGLLGILLIGSGSYVSAKKGNTKFQSVKITYQSSFNNTVDSTSHSVALISGNMEKLYSVYTGSDKSEIPQQLSFVDYRTHRLTKTATVKGQSIYSISPFQINKGLTLTNETKVIEGYTCKKAKTVINSNTIEIWYTNDLGVKGTMQPKSGYPDGLVLEIIKNGQYDEKAVNIELQTEKSTITPDLKGKQLSAPMFDYTIQQSRVISVNVFNNQPIYFRDIQNPATLSDTQVMQFARGSLVLKKVTLPKDNKGYFIFAELVQRAEGDAYDRTGSVFVIPTQKKQSFLDALIKGKNAVPAYVDKYGHHYQGMARTNDYLPPVELMRFYTPFGVGGYNHIKVANYNWPDSLLFKQEVTDYASLLKGEVWIGAWIGNYAKNGHRISLKIKYYPENPQNSTKEVEPLFMTTNVLEMEGQTYPDSLFCKDSLKVHFTTKHDLKNAYLRYISTGHGGWDEGDEFTPKVNALFLDSTHIMSYTPWREDCGSYRQRNPASGNFSNGESSSDLSRSGWCPGTVSYPIVIRIGDVKAGSHTVKVAIPVGAPDGSSRSYWCISGSLIGDIKE